MPTTVLPAPKGFSLSAASNFYAGFTPMGGSAESSSQTLHLAHLLDGSWEPIEVSLTQHTDGIHVTSDDPRTLRQLIRMLGLDADGTAWANIGLADPRIGMLQREFAGFFTAGFPSALEAGINGVLSHRSSIAQATSLRKKISAAHGTHFGTLSVIPTPEQWLGLKAFPGLAAQKLDVIQGLARAALEGDLDADTLRSLPTEVALEKLQRLHGIGPWTASHMLFRGCTVQDALPTTEPRLMRAFEFATGAKPSTFEARSQQWNPFRMWVGILMVRHLAAAGLFTSPAGERRQRGRSTTRISV